MVLLRTSNLYNSTLDLDWNILIHDFLSHFHQIYFLNSFLVRKLPLFNYIDIY